MNTNLTIRPVVVGIAIIVILIGGGILSLTWNYLIPRLFNGPRLAFWQAVVLIGLFSLISAIFGK